MARLHTKNLGTSIFPLDAMRTMTTHPFPKRANRKTIHTEHLRVHQSKRSLHGKKGPGAGLHWIPGGGVALRTESYNLGVNSDAKLAHNSLGSSEPFSGKQTQSYIMGTLFSLPEPQNKALKGWTQRSLMHFWCI